MINILELIDGGFLGGGQTHILSVVKNLNKEKFNSIIAASSNGEFRKEVDKCGFSFSAIELPKFYDSKLLKNIEEICRKNKINIIHSHGGVAGMYARFYKKKYKNVKVIHTIHGIHYMNSGNFIKKYVSHYIEKTLVKYTDRFICVSDADFKTAKEMKIIDPEKSVVIKNGIDLSRFTKKDKCVELMSKLGLNNDDIIIGNISRFDFQKNQRLIISNAKFISEKYTNVKILLAGNGKYFDECRKMADETGFREKFIFTGEINNPEVYYNLFDIFIFPTLWEGLSISLIESMSSGNCILASNIPANAELIQNEKNGLVFDLKNNTEFTDKLERLLEDINLRIKLSENALSDSKKYSEKLMTEKIEKEYSAII